MPKLSIIIPVYAASQTLESCLESVLAQTLDEIEVILVDDHGPDDSIALAREYLKDYAGPKRFLFTETLVNAGPGPARRRHGRPGLLRCHLPRRDADPSAGESAFPGRSAERKDAGAGHAPAGHLSVDLCFPPGIPA